MSEQPSAATDGVVTTMQLATPAMYKLDEKKRAPNDLSTREFAECFGADFSPDIARKLRDVFMHIGARTVKALKKASRNDVKEALDLEEIKLGAGWLDTISTYIHEYGDTWGLMDTRASAVATLPPEYTKSSTGGFHERKYQSSEENVSVTTLVGGITKFNMLGFPKPVLEKLRMQLTGKIDLPGATTTVFMLYLVAFNTSYIEGPAKTRFATLLHDLNTAVSINEWVNTLGSGFSNRRLGRFKEPMVFNPKDLIGNTEIPMLCHQFPEKFGQNELVDSILGFEIGGFKDAIAQMLTMCRRLLSFFLVLFLALTRLLRLSPSLSPTQPTLTVTAGRHPPPSPCQAAPRLPAGSPATTCPRQAACSAAAFSAAAASAAASRRAGPRRNSHLTPT